MSALRKYPRRPVSELASEVGVSTKTIARRLTVMTHNKAFFLIPELDYRKFPGVASSILITVSDEAMKVKIDKQVLARLNPRLVIYRTDTKVSSAFTTLCVNMSEAEDFYRWVSRLNGVHDSQMDYLREIILPKEWLDKEIDRHVRDLTQHAHT